MPFSSNVAFSLTVTCAGVIVTLVGAFLTVMVTVFLIVLSVTLVMVIFAEPVRTPLICVPFTVTYLLLLVESVNASSSSSSPPTLSATGARS